MEQLNRVRAHVWRILLTSAKRVSFAWFVLPVGVVLTAFLVVLNQMPPDYSQWWDAHKRVLESLALILTGGAFGIALLRVAMTKGSTFSFWLSGLALIVWFREIHWEWMSAGVYVGLFVWAVIGCWKYTSIEKALLNRRTITLLALIFFSYAVAVTFDQQWWTDAKYMDKVGKLAGEVLEDLGHLFLVLLVGMSSWEKKGSIPVECV